jgi:hypothetical protein
LIDDDDYRLELRARLRETDLKSRLFNTDEPPFFKKAVDFVLQYHDRIQKDESRAPIFIR